MERGLKRPLRRVQRLGYRPEGYGFTLQEAPTVRSAAQLKRHWPRSCLDGWAQSDDQLQWEPEDLFIGRLLRHAQGLQRSVRAGEQQFWRGPSQRSALRLLSSATNPHQMALFS